MQQKQENTQQEQETSVVVPSNDETSLKESAIGGNGRRSVVSSDQIAKRPVDKNSKRFPFRMPRQNFTVFNIAHQNQSCVSKSAALRIIGIFSSQEAVSAHLKKNTFDLDTYVAPTHSWFQVTKAPVPVEKQQEHQTAIVDRVKNYIQRVGTDREKVVEQSTEEHFEERYNDSKSIYERKMQLEKEEL